MGSLNSILSIATGALDADTGAIQVTDNNISNAQTTGYTREQVNFSQASATIESNGATVGNGVELGATTSPVDQLLNLLIQQRTSAQSAATASSNILSSIESYFPTATGEGGDIGSALSTFFTSLDALSTNPTSSSLRQTAMSSAQSLVGAFNTTGAALESAQVGLNDQVSGDVNQINSLASQIAALNPEIQAAQASGGTGASSLVNQRDELVTRLSALAGISITTTNEGDQVSLSNGTTLVNGGQALALSTSTGTGSLDTVLDANGQNITDHITGGDLGGAIATRDTTLPSLMTQVDNLAYNFATAFNTAQTSGYDLNGNAGTALFNAGTSSTGAAVNIHLTTTAGSALALSSAAGSGNSGSNGNLAKLSAVQNNAMTPGGDSPTGAYTTIVDSVGTAASTADAQASALQTSLTQLQDQQSSESGVSIDDESSNLVVYQQAYQASAEVIVTVRSLFTATIDMFGSGS